MSWLALPSFLLLLPKIISSAVYFTRWLVLVLWPPKDCLSLSPFPLKSEDPNRLPVLKLQSAPQFRSGHCSATDGRTEEYDIVVRVVKTILRGWSSL